MSKKTKPVRLSLACGQNIPEGFEGVDIHPGKGVKYVGDLFDFWTKDSVWKQIPDNSVDEIEASMLVEHIPHVTYLGSKNGMKEGFDDCFYLFFDEIYRVLKKAEFEPDNPNVPTRGFARLITPYYTSMRCWQDPTHARAISEASYLYLNKKWREDNKLDHYPVKCDFDYFYNYNLDGSLANRNQEFQMNAVRTQNNSVSDIIVTIVKR